MTFCIDVLKMNQELGNDEHDNAAARQERA
jgi:hypothetical protein